MDDSWNFLKEAPSEELALVIVLFQKLGIDISENATADEIISCICKHYSLELTYERFLELLCQSYCPPTVDNPEKKEMFILKQILFERIRKMDKDTALRFASNYSFSNWDSEKLINEVRARINNSKRFQSELAKIDTMLLGVNPSLVIPSYSDSFCIESDNSIECGWFPVAAIIIALRWAHCHIKYEYIEKYLDLAIVRNCKNVEYKKAYLSVMLELFVSLEKETKHKKDIDEIKEYLGSYKPIIPNYILNAISAQNCHQELINHIMELLFHDKNGIYESTSYMVQSYSGKIAFFDYLFPYTDAKAHNAFFLQPKDEYEHRLVRLYLRCLGKMPDDCLLSENDLLKMNFDYAVLSYGKSKHHFGPGVETIYTEDAIIDAWETFFFRMNNEDNAVIDYQKIMEFLSLFLNGNYFAVLPKLKKIIIDWVNDHNRYVDLKAIVQGLYGYEKFKSIFGKVKQ